MSDLIAQFWPWLAIVGMAVFGWFGGRSSARHAERVRRLENQIKGMENVRQAREEVDGLSDDDVRARARERMRRDTDG